jgi:hypothetical protein
MPKGVKKSAEKIVKSILEKQWDYIEKFHSYKSIPARSLTFGSILSLSETSPFGFDESP